VLATGEGEALEAEIGSIYGKGNCTETLSSQSREITQSRRCQSLGYCWVCSRCISRSSFLSQLEVHQYNIYKDKITSLLPATMGPTESVLGVAPSRSLIVMVP
jgi:hypothetical protein